MKTIIATIILLLLNSVSYAEQTLKFGSLSLQWPDGWRSEESNGEQRLLGPNGEKVIVTVSSLRPAVAEDEAVKAIQSLHDFANSQMPRLAEAVGGTVTRPLQRDAVDDVHVNYSTVSQKKGFFGQSYYLQYFLVGRRSGVFLTLEGKGDAVPKADQFDKIVSTAYWHE